MTGIMQVILGGFSAAAPYFFGRVGPTNINQFTYTQAVDFTSSKNTIFVGSETPPSVTQYATVFSLNPDKTTQFQKKYSQTSVALEFSNVNIDSSDNIYCAGSHSSSITVGILTKLNSLGVLQWSRTLGSPTGIYYLTGVGTDSSGNVYVGAWGKPDTSTGVYGMIVAKYNSSGTLQWQRQLEQSTGNNVAFYTDSSGNSYITGYSRQSGIFYGYVAKYNSSGTIQWQRQFKGISDGSGGAVTTDSSGNVYVTGTSNDGINSDGIIIKYNSAGTLQWQRKFGLVTLSSAVVDSSGHVFACGEINAIDPYKGSIVKYNSSGTIQWQRQIDATLSGQNFKYWRNSAAINSNGDLGVVGITGQAAGGASNNLGMIGLFPNNGAFTGTYIDGGTTYTISAGTQTDAAGTTTDSSASLTDSASSLTSTSVTLTEASISTLISLVNVP